MGRHRQKRGQAAPEPVPAAESLEDQLWNVYVEAKEANGTDDTTTWDAFFDWWVET